MRKQAIVGIAIIACGVFIVLSNLQSINIFTKGKHGEQASQAYDVSELDRVIVESGSTNVKVVPANGDQVKLKLYDSSDKTYDLAEYVTSEMGSKTLELDVSSPKKWFSLFNFRSVTFEIEVPKELLQDLTIESKSGNITAEDIVTTDSITLEATSGNIKLEKANTRSFTGETNSGNVTVEKLTTQEAELEATSGNVKLTDFTAQELQIESNSGNITVDGDTASIDAKTTSGNIKLELEQLTKNSKLKSNSGNVKLSLDNADSLYVTHERNSGSSSISKSGFELHVQTNHKTEGSFGSGDVKLDVKTTSGNFQLN